MIHRLQPSDRSGDQGAILVLALIVLLAVGLLTLTLADFAMGTGVTASNVRNADAVNVGAEDAALVAIQGVRTSYAFPTQTAATTVYNAASVTNPTAQSCMPTTPQSSYTVSCIGYAGIAASSVSRTVDFYVCGTAAINGDPTACAGASSNVLLFTEVTYNDIPAGSPASAEACSAVSSASCGMSMTISKWDVRNADA